MNSEKRLNVSLLNSFCVFLIFLVFPTAWATPVGLGVGELSFFVENREFRKVQHPQVCVCIRWDQGEKDPPTPHPNPQHP